MRPIASEAVRVLLVSTYELGRQPVALAGPAARLRRAGHEVRCLDLAVEPLDDEAVDWADRVAISVPMHTAMRLGRQAVAAIRDRQPGIPVCYYGLYAGAAGTGLSSEVPGGGPSADAVVAGEFEPGLEAWAAGASLGPAVRLGRVPERPTDRRALPPLDRYARLVAADGEHLVGAVEASRGCSHRCRHCPVPVVYDGRVRPVDVAEVVADVDRLVEAGATHVTFADPDFLNAPRHAGRVVEAIGARHPRLTFDCTVKVEHVLRYAHLWPDLADAGCRFVVSAFESTDEAVLRLLAKGHTAEDASAAVSLLRRHHIEARPSWLPFTPWTTGHNLVELLDFVLAHDLVENVDPVQYSIRLLVPRGSLLLDQPELASSLGTYDDEHLGWTWSHPDPAIDELQRAVAALVEARAEDPIADVFGAVDATVRSAVGGGPPPRLGSRAAGPPGPRPRLTEAWFCCSEPTATQLAPLTAGRCTGAVLG